MKTPWPEGGFGNRKVRYWPVSTLAERIRRWGGDVPDRETADRRMIANIVTNLIAI